MSTAAARVEIPNDLEAFWLPFTPNRAFKKAPRLVSRAKDMHYYTPEGREILDACAALWCCNAGHNRAPIVAAIQRQAAELDFAPTFQFAHPKAFELAARLAALAPGDLDHVFFTNSGSEAGRHRAEDRARLPQRARRRARARASSAASAAITASASAAFRSAAWSTTASSSARCWPASTICRATYNREQQAFTKGEPEWGAPSRRRARAHRRRCTTPRPSPP